MNRGDRNATAGGVLDCITVSQTEFMVQDLQNRAVGEQSFKIKAHDVTPKDTTGLAKIL